MAAGVLIAARFGLAAQGEFALLKNWSDAVVVAATLGLPQALLHLQYREGLPTRLLVGWLRRYTLAVAGVTAVLIAGLWLAPKLVESVHLSISRSQIAVLAAGIPFAVAHLLLRSLSLKRSVVRFSALTAAPAALMLVGLLAAILVGWRPGFEWIITGSAMVSALVTATALRRDLQRAQPSQDTPSWSTRRLWSIGLQTGTQNLIAAFTPALLLSVAAALGATLHELGTVSLGLYVYQAFSVLASYSAPLIYDRAARLDRHQLSSALQGRQHLMRRIGLGVGLLAVLTAIAPIAIPEHTDLVWAFALNAGAGLCALLVRTMWSVMQAQGAFAVLSVQAVSRLALTLALLVAFMGRLPTEVSVPLALLLGECALVAWLSLLIKRELSLSKNS